MQERRTGPWLLASAVVLALLVAPFAVAAGEGGPLLGGKRNPGADQTLEYTSETEIIASSSTYGTRQSNKSDNGGGAIYGCRSRAGGTERNNEPCIRANNLSDGRAFEFVSDGLEVGVIRSSNPNAAPFTTTARGVATGLNADQVDGKGASEVVADAVEAAKDLNRFAQVTSTGAAGHKRGVSGATRTGTGTYQVVFEKDVDQCGLSATATEFEDSGAVAVGLAADKRTVTVRTRDGAGTVADRAFHLIANC